MLSKDGPAKSEFKDLQLAKALEFLGEKLGIDKAGEKKTEPKDKDNEKDAKKEADKKKSAAAEQLKTLNRLLRTARQELRIDISAAT